VENGESPPKHHGVAFEVAQVFLRSGSVRFPVPFFFLSFFLSFFLLFF
jgi:hypothetical protein